MNGYMGAPIFYDYANAATASVNPNQVHAQNVQLTNYFRRYLLQKVISVFKWNLPKNWNRDYFLYVLYCWGRVAVIQTDKFGVIPQGCDLRGYNVFYQPTNAIITNPLLKGLREPEIGTECVLLKLQPDYGTVMDLVNYYAELMALCSVGVSVNLLNTKLAYVFGAKNKAAAKSFERLYDEVASGKPLVVMDKALQNDDGTSGWDTFSQNLGQNYIADRILSDMRKIEAMFDTDIGLPNANTDKRERLITDEVNANNAETYTRCALWLESLKQGCADVKSMFGVDVSVDWRVDPMATPEPVEKEETTDAG